MPDECTAAGDITSVRRAWLGVFLGFRSLNSAVFDQVTERTGLPDSSFLVLSHLLNQPGHGAPMSRLARHLEFSTAGITKVTDRLSQAGLLERRPCPTDRRVVFAVLSADGAAMAHRIDAALEDAVRDLLVARTGEEDFGRLVEIMAKVRSGLPGEPC